MASKLEDLVMRIQRIEDIEAIKQLKALYCEICDDGHNPDRITTIFTEDGIWEGPGIATAEGHAEIRKLFERFGELMGFTQHMTMNPRISIEGETAEATWYFFGPFTFHKGPQARWQAARYRELYRKVDGQWKITHLKIEAPSMTAAYESGWADESAFVRLPTHKETHMAVLETIFAAESHGFRQSSRNAAELTEGVGLKGDRYAGDGIVSLIEAEAVEAFNAATGLSISPGATGRNLVTRGVRLNPLVGQRFRVGEALLEGTELCEPCAMLGKQLSTESVAAADIVRAFTAKAGIRARVVSSGTIEPGASVGPT